MSYTYAHLSVKDTTTQPIAVADTPQVVTFNTSLTSDKIIITSPSRFTVNEGGGYLLNAAAQISTSSPSKTIDMWFRVNGVDVTDSNSKVVLKDNGDVALLPITGLYVQLSAGDYIEVWLSGDSTALSLIAFAAGTSPTRPITPSINMSILKEHP